MSKFDSDVRCNTYISLSTVQKNKYNSTTFPHSRLSFCDTCVSLCCCCCFCRLFISFVTQIYRYVLASRRVCVMCARQKEIEKLSERLLTDGVLKMSRMYVFALFQAILLCVTIIVVAVADFFFLFCCSFHSRLSVF